jgi:uncharacterized cupin superfamily protein
MTKITNILRFDQNGPNGLEEWEQMNYDSLVSGQPVQHGHLYHEISKQGYMVGIWDCTAFTDQMMPYTVDEYMFFLEGELTMLLPNGTEIEIKAGDAFIIPKGFECQWKQTGFVRKIFMILDGEVPNAGNASLKRITVPNLSQPDSVDVTMSRRDFLNAAGNMCVEIQGHGAVVQMGRTSGANELITILEGSLQLYDGEKAHVFNTGDTAYLLQGDVVDWKTNAGTRLIVASYTSPD